MNEATLAYQGMSADEVVAAARALVAGEPSLLANMANVASLVFHALPGLNWAGFYLFDGRELSLGPFQGRPACTRIALSRGVCGAAARERRTQVVPDVRAFPGHIACDPDSRAEIVVPLVDGASRLLAVLDLDSPVPGRFGDAERALLEQLAALLVASAASPDWRTAPPAT